MFDLKCASILVDKNTNPDKQTTTESGQKSFFKVKIKPSKEQNILLKLTKKHFL